MPVRVAAARPDWLTRMVRRGILALYTGSSEGEMQMTRILRRTFAAVMSFLVVAMVAVLALPAAAAPDEVIVLPGATSAEGIATGGGTTFYAGDLFTGDIFRGDVQRGTAALFIDAPAGRMAVGMTVDLDHDLLFVAGGFTGQAMSTTPSPVPTVAEPYQFGAAGHDGQRRSPHQRRCLVYRFVPAQALLRAGQRGRRSGGVPSRCNSPARRPRSPGTSTSTASMPRQTVRRSSWRTRPMASSIRSIRSTAPARRSPG